MNPSKRRYSPLPVLFGLLGATVWAHASEPAPENLPVSLCYVDGAEGISSLHVGGFDLKVAQGFTKEFDLNFLKTHNPTLSTLLLEELEPLLSASAYQFESLKDTLARATRQETVAPCAEGETRYDVDAFPAPVVVTGVDGPRILLSRALDSTLDLTNLLLYVGMNRALNRHATHTLTQNDRDSFLQVLQGAAAQKVKLGEFYAAMEALFEKNEAKFKIESILNDRFATSCGEWFSSAESCIAFFTDLKAIPQYSFTLTPARVKTIRYKQRFKDETKKPLLRSEIFELADFSQTELFSLSDLSTFMVDEAETRILFRKVKSLAYNPADLSLILRNSPPDLVAAYFEKIPENALASLSEDDMTGLIMSFSYQWSNEDYRLVLKSVLDKGVLFTPLSMGSVKVLKPESMDLVQSVRDSLRQKELMKRHFVQPQKLYCLAYGAHDTVVTDLIAKHRFFLADFDITFDNEHATQRHAFHSETPFRGEFKIPTPSNRKKFWTVNLQGIANTTMQGSYQDTTLDGFFDVNDKRGRSLRKVPVDMRYSTTTLMSQNFASMQTFVIPVRPTEKTETRNPSFTSVFCNTDAALREQYVGIMKKQHEEILHTLKLGQRLKRLPGKVKALFQKKSKTR